MDYISEGLKGQCGSPGKDERSCIGVAGSKQEYGREIVFVGGGPIYLMLHRENTLVMPLNIDPIRQESN
jgi:hypothetical protein